MAYVNDIRAEYTPYNNLPAFSQGMRDYHGHCSWQHLEGVAAQAYDRGLECAMRIERAERWIDENVGAN